MHNMCDIPQETSKEKKNLNKFDLFEEIYFPNVNVLYCITRDN